MNPCHYIVRGDEESVSAIYKYLDTEGKDEETWFILDMWAISWFLAFPEYNETYTSRFGANIKQKWPSSLWKPHSHHIVQTPTRRSEHTPAGRSTAVTSSVHAVHLWSAKCYPKHFSDILNTAISLSLWKPGVGLALVHPPSHHPLQGLSCLSLLFLLN